MRKLIGWQGVVASALVCRGEASIVTRYTLSVKLRDCISATVAVRAHARRVRK